VNKVCSDLKKDYKTLMQETIRTDPHSVVEDESTIFEMWYDERIRLVVLEEKLK